MNITYIKKNLIKHMSFYLHNKLYLLKKEANHTKLSLKYIECVNDNEQNISNHQFLLDVQLILNLNEEIIRRIEEIENEMKEKIHENKSLIDLIIEYDCINERINNSLIKKYEYVHIAYENLVLSYNFLYLPTTTISKAAKTPNLMLYFNYMINEIYNKLIDRKNNILFSTWNFIDTDKTYTFFNYKNKNNNSYIEFSFWLYEMPIFHPISFHEIFHTFYDNSLKDNISLKFNDEDLIYIKDNLPEQIINKLGITTDLLVKIFEEMLADIFSYLLVGENYIYILFVNGFMFNISKSFYKKDGNKCCLKKEKEILNFDFDNRNFMYILRMYSLLDYIMTKGEKDYFIEFIKEIFDFIFPEGDFKQIHENNFEKILENFVTYKNYLLIKESLFIFRKLFNNILIKKGVYKKLEKLKKDLENKFKNSKTSSKETESNFFASYKNLFSTYKDKIKELRDFDKKEFININHLLQKEYRKKNIDHILKNKENKKNEENENQKIYYLTFIKICRKILDHNKDAFIFFCNNQKNSSHIIHEINYAFGPYDFVSLGKKDKDFINKLENFFTKEDFKYKFFIENHSLYLLDNVDNVDNVDNDKFFDLLFLFDIKEAFNNFENMRNFYNKMNEFLQKEKRYKFFISMGNENFVLKIDYLNDKDIEEKINNIHKSEFVKQYVYHLSTTVLFNSNLVKLINENNKQSDTSCISHIIIFLKVDLSKMDEVIRKLKDFKYKYFKEEDKKMFIYKKLGIYDVVIIFNKIYIKELNSLIEEIDEYVLDVQIEKEIKV